MEVLHDPFMHPKHGRIQRLFILGCGYVGFRLARACLDQGIRVRALTRSADKARMLAEHGIEALMGDVVHATPSILNGCDALLDSIPIDLQKKGVPQKAFVTKFASFMKGMRWIGYLSSTSVYGDAAGGWVDEASPCRPTGMRGRLRLQAEKAWLGTGLPVEVFRIGGIYGPGRNLLSKIASGYRVVCWDPPHWSNRIHVDDIVAALLAAMKEPKPGRIINLVDDDPRPHVEYVTVIAKRIGAPPPEVIPQEEARSILSPTALEFFRDSKRVSNRRLHRELLPRLKYPSFVDAIPHLALDARKSMSKAFS